jgi:hypothetical protein
MKYVIGRNIITNRIKKTFYTQYHTPRGWSNSQDNAYHFDYQTALDISRKMVTPLGYRYAFPVYAASNAVSNVRRVG